MPVTIRTITIPAGESLSDACDAKDGNLIQFEMPDQWSPANISFQASADGTTFRDLVDAYGAEVLMAVIVNTTVVPLALKTFQYFKIRSGSRGQPINQQQDRVFKVVIQT